MVDSNVLIDVLSDDPQWYEWSADAIEEAGAQDRLVINAVIFAEVSIGYARKEVLDGVLAESSFEREAMPFEAAFLAGKAFLAYRRHGGTRRAPLPEFFIGAHAGVAGYRLLTRDAARYRTYFPRLPLIAPN